MSDRARVDVLRLEQVLDLALGLLFDPVVDVLPRGPGGLAEVDRVKPAVIVAFDQLLELGEDSLARLRPERVGGESSNGTAGFGPACGVVLGCADRRSGDETRGEARPAGSVKCMALATCAAVSPRAPA